MKQTFNKYSDLYPDFSDFVENPDAQAGKIIPKHTFDLYCLWFPGEANRDKSIAVKFKESCIEWDIEHSGLPKSKIFTFAATEDLYIHELAIEFDLTDWEMNTDIIIHGIKKTLSLLDNKNEKLNYLLSIRKKLDQDCFIAPVERNDDEVLRFLIPEIDYLKNYREDELEGGNSDFMSDLKEERLKKSNSAKKRIMLLSEFGVIDFLEAKYKLEGNYSKLGKMLEPMLEINNSTIRKYIEAIKKPNEKNAKDFPYTNQNTNWLSYFLSSLKLPQK